MKFERYEWEALRRYNPLKLPWYWTLYAYPEGSEVRYSLRHGEAMTQLGCRFAVWRAKRRHIKGRKPTTTRIGGKL